MVCEFESENYSDELALSNVYLHIDVFYEGLQSYVNIIFDKIIGINAFIKLSFKSDIWITFINNYDTVYNVVIQIQ